MLEASAQELCLDKLNGVDAGMLAAGQQSLARYSGVTIRFLECPGRAFVVPEIIETKPHGGDVEVILGRFFLRWFLMTYDGPAGRVFLEYADGG